MTKADIRDLYNLAMAMHSVKNWLKTHMPTEEPSDEALRAIEAVHVEAKDLLAATNTYFDKVSHESWQGWT
jgi:hypothetical protein